jgi:hypothetical protein
LSDDAIRGLENFDKLAKQYGSQGYSVGNTLCWADLFIHEITYSLMAYQADLLDKFSLLKNIRETVESNKNVADYLKNRPVTPF